MLMTEKQQRQFNAMRAALIHIAKSSQEPSRLRRKSEKSIWADYTELLEVEYQDIRTEAWRSVKGIREIKTPGTIRQGNDS